MKQTNSAIKFLLAQYRAIFKHAQLASILAVAAASAISIGQAQAATGGTTFGNDQLAAADADVTIDGTSADGTAKDNEYGTLTLTGGAERTNEQKITVKITGGAKNTIKGLAATSGNTDAKPNIDFGGSSLVIEAAADATLTIGESGATSQGATTGMAATNVIFGNLSVKKGTLALVADASKADYATTVSADIVSIGGGTPAGGPPAAAPDATVTIVNNSSITANTALNIDDGAKITVENGGSLLGGKVVVSKGSVKLGSATPADSAATFGATGAEGLTINDGKVEVVASGKAVLTGSLTLAGGEIANSGSLTIGGEGKTFTADNGTLSNAASSSLTLAGKNEFGAKSTISNSGDLVIRGTTTFNNESSKVTAGAASKLIMENGATVTMSADVLKSFLSGSVQSNTGTSGTIVIDAGDSIFDLASGDIIFGSAKAAQPAVKGQLNSKIQGGNGELTLKFNKASFTDDDALSALAANGDVTISAQELTLGKEQNKDATFVISGAKFAVLGGLKTTDDKALKLVGDSKLSLSTAAESTIASKSITLGDAASGAGNLVVSKGNWTTNELTVTSGTASVSNGAKLTLTKGLTTAGDKGKLVVTGVGSTVDAVGVETLSLASGGLALESAGSLVLKGDKVVDTATGALKSGFEKGSVSGSTDTKLTLLSSGDESISMTVENYSKFRTAAGFKGIIDIKLSDTPKAEESMPLDGQGSVIAGVTNGYEKTQAQVSGDVTDNYYVGNVKVTNGNNLSLGADGALTLSNANANNTKGQYVTNKDGGVGSVSFTTEGNTLTLAGEGGKIGAITNAGDGHGSISIGKGTDVEVVSGSIGSTAGSTGNAGAVGKLNVLDGGSLTLESGSVYSNNLSLGTGAQLNVGTGDVEVKNKAEIMGDITAGTLSITGKNTNDNINVIAGNAEINVDKLVVGQDVALRVGEDGKKSTSATIYTKTLDMQSGAVLFVDPEYTEKAAIVVAESLDPKNTKEDAGTLSGGAYVGMNSALGIGFTEDEFKSYMAQFLDKKGAFTKDPKVKNALALNKKITIASGNGITVDAELKSSDFTSTSKPAAGTLTIKNGGGLILTENAFGANKVQAAITFDLGATGGTANVNVDAETTINLVGKFSANDDGLQFFTATKTNGGATTTEHVKLDNKITVVALGGMLTGTIDATTTTNAPLKFNSEGLHLAENAKTLAYAGVSRPVGDMFIAVANGVYDTATGSGVKFVTDTMSLPDGAGYKIIDAAAHAATYAGAQQAAVAAVTTMAEAVGSRVSSMGVESYAITATGSQANGGVWLTPMYKSVDADGFAAEGASYGADVDLAGVAFGADTVNGNMRFGAVFNIGSGDADGKGNGNGLKDEFDYYGFGIYSVMGFGQFSLVGDASLNVISHEVEASGLGVKAKADTTAVTMGITGQYAISTSSVDVVPHLGARFIRLDTDSYDLADASGAFASTDFDVQNVFSVPLGVSISKAIEMGGWSLAPSADFSITFNTGDTDVKSSTMFHGMSALDLTSEVLDEVTYGVAVGLGAQYGAFGTHIGLNYTGSENTDSFGVNAQARYMF